MDELSSNQKQQRGGGELLRKRQKKARPVIRIAIIADTACPWSHLGIVRLDHVLRQYSSVEYKITCRPYILNASLASDHPPTLEEYYRELFGAERGVARIRVLEDLYETEGVTLNRDVVVTPSLNSHRLLFHASKHGKEYPLLRELYRLHFILGKDLNAPSVLREAAVGVGLTDAEEVIADPACYRDQVKILLHQNQRVGSVPVFIFEGIHRLEGCPTTEALEALFKGQLSLSTDKELTLMAATQDNTEAEEEEAEQSMSAPFAPEEGKCRPQSSPCKGHSSAQQPAPPPSLAPMSAEEPSNEATATLQS